eukprot:3276493-Ditylum_brightwellii.AAC.1
MCRKYHTDTIQPTTPIITTFKSYLNILEPWGYLILKDLVLEISAYEIAQICHTDACINIASNSSVESRVAGHEAITRKLANV